MIYEEELARIMKVVEGAACTDDVCMNDDDNIALSSPWLSVLT